jgi:hypothetical protein
MQTMRVPLEVAAFVSALLGKFVFFKSTRDGYVVC